MVDYGVYYPNGTPEFQDVRRSKLSTQGAHHQIFQGWIPKWEDGEPIIEVACSPPVSQTPGALGALGKAPSNLDVFCRGSPAVSLEQSSTMAVTWLRQWGSLDGPEPMILLMYEIAPIDTGNNTVVFRTIPKFSQ